MGHSTFTAPWSQSSDANYRSTVGAILTGLTSGGWTQTSDTGQVTTSNYTSLTKPTGTGATGAGSCYAVFSVPGALSSSAPLLVRLMFGTRSTSSDFPSMWVTIGSGTDGAGNVTPTLLSTLGITCGTGLAGTASGVNCWAASGDGWLAFQVGYGEATARGYPTVVIERSRDTDGSPTASGVGLLVPCSANSTGARTSLTGVLRCIGASLTSSTNVQGLIPVVIPGLIQGTALGNTTSLAAGGIGPVFPVVYMAPGVAPWQSMAVVAIPQGDLPGSAFSTTLLGQGISMMPFVSSLDTQWGIAQSADTGTALAYSEYVGVGVRWDE